MSSHSYKQDQPGCIPNMHTFLLPVKLDGCYSSMRQQIQLHCFVQTKASHAKHHSYLTSLKKGLRSTYFLLGLVGLYMCVFTTVPSLARDTAASNGDVVVMLAASRRCTSVTGIFSARLMKFTRSNAVCVRVYMFDVTQYTKMP